MNSSGDRKTIGSGVAILILGLGGVGALIGIPLFRAHRLRSDENTVRGMMPSIAAAQLRSQGKVWTQDVAGPFPSLAEADTSPGGDPQRPRTPFHGYFFRSLDPMTRWHDSAFDEAPGPCAVYAYPAVYGRTGILTYFITGPGFFSKDTDGVCPDKVLLPKELREGGWSLID